MNILVYLTENILRF